MYVDVDWSKRGIYVERKYGVRVAEANEALRDPGRVVVVPDYASKSGRTVRVIGYSSRAEAVLSVLVLEDDGIEYGVNCWRSNAKDKRLYYERSQA